VEGLKNLEVEIVSWEKIGVTVVSKPASHGSGLYLRVLKNLVEAYDLWTAEMVEFTIDRVRRPEPGNATLSEKRGIPKSEKRKGEAEE